MRIEDCQSGGHLWDFCGGGYNVAAMNRLIAGIVEVRRMRGLVAVKRVAQ